MTRLVADSGPLIALASSDHLGLLVLGFDEVFLPELVLQECTTNLSWPGAATIAMAVSKGELRRMEMDTPKDLGKIHGLDAGEAQVLAAAVSLQAMVLMDDAVGRQIARTQGIPVVGACGILLQAKKQGRIASIAPILHAWRVEVGYHLSDRLVQEVLRIANEGSSQKTEKIVR